ncbi:MAG: tRNA wybutosine-synthesizing protein 1 [Blastocatellia bacterium]|jgi:hypothetical protein|nr:tRNA wybutosine-synthesizing protein 1 [Blastocatellia bacterium]
MQAERNAKSRPVYEHLDTAFVNLAALLRYLRQRAFVGRVHVVLAEYEAEVMLDEGGAEPRVREVDHATGRHAEDEAALARLLVRSREPGGLINVYEGAEDETAGAASLIDESEAAEDDAGSQPLTPEESEWRDLLRASGEVIAAVERAALSAQADFAALFRAARLELADDFSFLDPATRRFEYAHATVRLQSRPGTKAYVAGVGECLRRVVEKMAKGAQSKRLRERVALELAVLARRRQTQLARFKLAQQFDRIAGTRVL